MTQDVKFFNVLISHLDVFFGEVSFKILPIANQTVYFLFALKGFKKYVLKTNPLSDTRLAGVAGVLIFSMSFKEKKGFHFNKVQITIFFSFMANALLSSLGNLFLNQSDKGVLI